LNSFIEILIKLTNELPKAARANETPIKAHNFALWEYSSSKSPSPFNAS